MSCEYVRRYYGMPAKIGRRVVIGGKPGIIAADRGHYIGVNFDSDKPGVIHNAHPTSEVRYLGMSTPRKPTRSQLRYLRYLDVADCYESFAHYLRASDSTSVISTEESRE
jgi:hypothetical protein